MSGVSDVSDVSDGTNRPDGSDGSDGSGGSGKSGESYGSDELLLTVLCMYIQAFRRSVAVERPKRGTMSSPKTIEVQHCLSARDRVGHTMHGHAKAKQTRFWNLSFKSFVSL